jgi:MFS family permease
MDERPAAEIRPLSRERRVSYIALGGSILASAIFMAIPSVTEEDQLAYFVCDAIIAILGLAAIGFGLFAKYEAYTPPPPNLPAPVPVEPSPPQKELWELPGYQRYAIAAVAIAGAVWLGQSDQWDRHPSWLMGLVIVGLVGTALVAAWELGCWVIGLGALIACVALIAAIVPALTTPVAVIIGAIIIGAMVSGAINRNRQ